METILEGRLSARMEPEVEGPFGKMPEVLNELFNVIAQLRHRSDANGVRLEAAADL